MNINCNANNYLNFCKNPIYAINVKEGAGSLRKFDSIASASKELRIPNTSISSVLSGKNYVTADYSFFYANDFNFALSNEDIQRRILNSVQANLENAYSQPIYAIDLQGNYRRFNNPKETALYFDIEHGEISRFLKADTRNPICKNHVLVKASSVENRNQQGVPILSVKALNQARNMFLKATSCPIVAISESKNVEILRSQKAVMEKFKISSSRLSTVLSEGPKASKGRVFVKLDDVVVRNKKNELVFDNDNNFVLDEKKIHEYWLHGFYGRLLKPLR